MITAENGPKKKRVLLKLSGEALINEGHRGINPQALKEIAEEIADAYKCGNCELTIVLGGGNIWRGLRDGGGVIDRVNSDNMGMLATVINALALQSALEEAGVPTRVLTSINIYQLAEPFVRRKAERHLEKGRIVIFAGGTGNPFFTTDSAAALRASEINADVLLKATQVDGVYDSDPAKNADAVKFDSITYDEVLKRHLAVMDSTATSLSMDNHIPVLVFALKDPYNIVRALRGEKIGTIVKEA